MACKAYASMDLEPNVKIARYLLIVMHYAVRIMDCQAIRLL